MPPRAIDPRGIAAVPALLLAGLASAARAEPVGLFTTLPIVWNEAEDIAGLLRSDERPHWAREALAEQGEIVPLDRLAPMPPGLRLAVLAQPRALAPEENLALDRWVRGGGRLLLFADPLLTAHSVYALGDRRRPQATALLSPILTRWGLRLEFDEAQPGGARTALWEGAAIPVDLPGRFVATARRCAVSAGGLVARCKVGKGRVTALADAALLEPAGAGEIPIRREILFKLLKTLESAR